MLSAADVCQIARVRLPRCLPLPYRLFALYSLVRSVATRSSAGQFITVWANCTGLPSSAGLIAKISTAAVVIPPQPSPAASSSPLAYSWNGTSGGLTVPYVILIIIFSAIGAGLIAAALICFFCSRLTLTLCGCCPCCGGAARRRVGDGFPLTIYFAYSGTSQAQAQAQLVQSPLPPCVVYVDESLTLREAVSAALENARPPVNYNAVAAAAEAATLLFDKRSLPVSKHGNASLGSLSINRRTAGHNAVLQLAQAAPVAVAVAV